MTLHLRRSTNWFFYITLHYITVTATIITTSNSQFFFNQPTFHGLTTCYIGYPRWPFCSSTNRIKALIENFQELKPNKMPNKPSIASSCTKADYKIRSIPYRSQYQCNSRHYHRGKYRQNIETFETHRGCCDKPTPAVTWRMCCMQSGSFGVYRSNEEHRGSAAAQGRLEPWRNISSSDREAQDH